MSCVLFSKKEQKLLERAYQASEKATHKQFQIGCIIYDKGIISIGYNQGKTHPDAININSMVNKLHAEMFALKYSSKRDLRGACIVVVRKGLHGNPRTAKPCELCLEQIKEAGIKKVIYSITDGHEVIEL